MKQIEVQNYGKIEDVIFNEVEKPAIGDNDVLVKIHAASVNFNTLIFITGKPFLGRIFTGMFKPRKKTPGNDFAGKVEAVGKNVTQIKSGDEVFGDSLNFGTLAEYAVASENDMILKPKNLSFEEAATVPEVALVAYQGLKDAGKIQAGQKVLIAGASGGIGTFAVQFAKHFGAEVWATCSTKNIELVKSLGADHIIDYTMEDFITTGIQFDLILASAGNRPIKDYKNALSPKGVYVVVGGKMKQIFQAMLLGSFYSKKGGKTLLAYTVVPNKDLNAVKTLIEEGKVKPVIDKVYPFERSIEALKHYNSGKSCGKVIVSM